MVLDRSYGFHIHQAKFVSERLTPIVIPKGRRSDNKSQTSDEEKRQLRAVWGSVNGVQRETRPDVSALASLGLGSINRSTVQDLCDASTAVERLKAGLTFLFTKSGGLLFKTRHGRMLPRITVKGFSWLVRRRWSFGTTLHLHLPC